MSRCRSRGRLFKKKPHRPLSVVFAENPRRKFFGLVSASKKFVSRCIQSAKKLFSCWGEIWRLQYGRCCFGWNLYGTLRQCLHLLFRNRRRALAFLRAQRRCNLSCRPNRTHAFLRPSFFSTTLVCPFVAARWISLLSPSKRNHNRSDVLSSRLSPPRCCSPLLPDPPRNILPTFQSETGRSELGVVCTACAHSSKRGAAASEKER